MIKGYRLLNEMDRIKKGDMIFLSNKWQVAVASVGSKVMDSMIKRPIKAFEDTHKPDRLLQVTYEELDMIHECIDIQYHKTPHGVENDKLATIMQKLDASVDASF